MGVAGSDAAATGGQLPGNPPTSSALTIIRFFRVVITSSSLGPRPPSLAGLTKTEGKSERFDLNQTARLVVGIHNSLAMLSFPPPQFRSSGRQKGICPCLRKGCRRNWKTCHAGKRRRCRTESRPTSGAALRGGRDLPPLTRLSNRLHLSKRKGTGTMAGPPRSSPTSLW